MNNNIIFSFVLCIFSFVNASEKTKCQPIVAHVFEGNDDIERYMVKDIRKVDSWDLNNRKLVEIYYKYPETVLAFENVHITGTEFDSQNDMPKISLIIMDHGCTKKYGVQFRGSCYENLKKELKSCDDRPKFNNDSRFFRISLMDVTETKGIILELPERQVKTILLTGTQVKSILSAAKIGTVFGIVGLAALIYYFDLYSKGMTLVGRG